MNTEDSVPNEKKVVYDIHFYAYTPDEKGKVKIILDVEAQKKYHRKCQVFLQHFFKKIFNIVYLLFIIYNDII